MKSISGKRLCKIIEQKGWILQRVTLSHNIYENPVKNQIISISVPKNKDLKIVTLKALIKMAELIESDLI